MTKEKENKCDNSEGSDLITVLLEIASRPARNTTPDTLVLGPEQFIMLKNVQEENINRKKSKRREDKCNNPLNETRIVKEE